MTSTIHRTGQYSYNAVFSTGDSKQIKRGSRLFAAAFLVIVEYEKPEGNTRRAIMGFARDKDLAWKAIPRETNHLIGKGRYARNKSLPVGKIVHQEVIDVTPQHADNP